MDESGIARVESTLGVRLPEEYRAALLSPEASTLDQPEFQTDPDRLIEANDHFTFDPSDLSPYQQLWLTGLRLRLFPSARRRLSEKLAAHKREWAGNHRFFLGSDLGEEQFFIKLTAIPIRVYRFQLESGLIDVVANSIPEWLSEVGRRAADARTQE